MAVSEKVVIFSGAGVSAESGLRTFRDMNGYWNEYSIEEVASPQAWKKNPATVLAFYNERRAAVIKAEPNAAHRAIAKLEEKFDVVVITQNVDDLHERAGSSRVIHLHGEIMKARSSIDASLVYSMDKPAIEIGNLCEKGSQLRPHVVWFGEEIRQMEEASGHFEEASKILAAGTSLTVYPAAGLVKKAKFSAEKYFVAPDMERMPFGYRFLKGHAASVIPRVVECWLEGCGPYQSTM
jgi:NAD-dependent deacetylase